MTRCRSRTLFGHRGTASVRPAARCRRACFGAWMPYSKLAGARSRRGVMAFTRSIGAVLRASVASDGHLPEDVVSRRSPRELEGLTQAARFHGIPGYVYQAVREIDQVPPTERELLAAFRRETVRRHLRAIGDLRFVAEVLESA